MKIKNHEKKDFEKAIIKTSLECSYDIWTIMNWEETSTNLEGNLYKYLAKLMKHVYMTFELWSDNQTVYYFL